MLSGQGLLWVQRELLGARDRLALLGLELSPGRVIGGIERTGAAQILPGRGEAELSPALDRLPEPLFRGLNPLGYGVPVTLEGRGLQVLRSGLVLPQLIACLKEALLQVFQGKYEMLGADYEGF